MIQEWPSYIKFTGEMAEADQRAFAAHAHREAPTGVAYNHYQNGHIVLFGGAGFDGTNMTAEKPKPNPAHSCRPGYGNKCSICRKPYWGKR